MIKFEKVSYEQFAMDLRKIMPYAREADIQQYYDGIKLPKRGSKKSAGYDFYSPVPFELFPEDYGVEHLTIPTGIRAIMPDDMYLMVVPRSGVGFKTGVYLANTVGIIDADYAYGSNEGHIMVRLCPNYSRLDVAAGDRLVQGIFQKYYITDDDDAEGERTGGLGSTGA